MDEQPLFEEFHAAYDFEPRAGSFERLRATLVDSGVRTRRAGGLRLRVPSISLKLIAGMAIVVVGLAATGALIGIWKYAHPTIPAVEPPRACAINRPHILACTADDLAVVDQNKVLITHDGGRTWLTIQVPSFSDLPLMDFRWVDSNNIVIVVGSHLIEVTIDGGAHWRAITSGWTQGPNLPFFLNADQGWVLGESGLFHTTDGGAHWTVVSDFPSFSTFDFRSDRLYFSNSEYGFIWRGHDEPWVTHDGGRTWSQGVISPPPLVSQFGDVLQGPAMFGKSGLIGFWNADGTAVSVYETSDGGFTWSGPRSAPGRWFSPLNMSEWWLVDPTGGLWRTRDGGNSWRSVQTDIAGLRPATTLVAVMPVGDGALWGLATGGAVESGPNSILRSTDGGAHWSLVWMPGS